MKTLGTGKLYIKDLFDKDRFFRIPEYQRAYVWEAQQINELLNDANDAMESDPEKEYFLGCMIWNVVNKRTGGYAFDSLDILDGQQRLITLYLLHAVIRDLTEENQLKQKVQQRLKQQKTYTIKSQHVTEFYLQYEMMELSLKNLFCQKVLR